MSSDKKRIYTQDFYSQKAVKEGFRARSYYKLEEIDKKFALIRPGLRILDLGASPGSWSQYVLKKTSGKVKLFCVDLKPIEIFPHYPEVTLLQEDVFLLDFEKLGVFDLFLSDMAPNTSGIKEIDGFRSSELLEKTLEGAKKGLITGGNLVCKILQGGHEQEIHEKLKEVFHQVKRLKPDSSRKSSSEIFFIGLKKKAPLKESSLE